MPEQKRVAVLGATSHVAKNLIAENALSGRWEVVAVGRNRTAVQDFARSVAPQLTVSTLDEFFMGDSKVDAIVNCIGFGTPGKVREAGLSLFSVAEEVDNRILGWLEGHPGSRYVNFSSGAVYGTAMDRPVLPGDRATVEVSPLNSQDFYRISKIHQEAKHRSCSDFSIVDIRLFSFFSRFIDREASYLMNDVLRALDADKPFQTSRSELHRDYIAPSDLYELVDCIVQGEFFNGTVDTYSLAPIEKKVLLENLASSFGLRVEWTEGGTNSPTGTKPYYFSGDKAAQSLWGYRPRLSSWQAIHTELARMGYEASTN